MSAFKVFIVALALTGLFASDASAQLFRGGLIRKVLGREEEDEDEAKKKEKEEKERREKAREIAEQRRRAAGQPTPIDVGKRSRRMAIFGMELRQLKADGPIVVDDISKKGDAYDAGVRENDRVLAIAGMEIEDLQMLNGLESSLKTGDRIDLQVSRKGKDSQIELVFDHENAEEVAEAPIVIPNALPPKGTEDISLPIPLESPIDEAPAVEEIPSPVSPAAESIVSNADLSNEAQPDLTALLELLRQQQAVIERQAKEIERLNQESSSSQRRN